MSRIRVTKRLPGDSPKHKEWPAVVYLWALGLAFLSYVAARVGLSASPHPYHWLTGLLGGLAGIPLGWLWYRWRGDVL